MIKTILSVFVFIRYVIMQYDREKGYKTAAWYVRQITYGG